MFYVKKYIGLMLTAGLIVLLPLNPTWAGQNAEELVTRWEAFWNSYDLDELGSLFPMKDTVTYFSSEKVELIEGQDSLKAHHEGFGFVPGGKETKNRLWLEDVRIRHTGDVAIVSAIWYFETTREGSKSVMKGPVTFVATQEEGDYKFTHTHFANYPE